MDLKKVEEIINYEFKDKSLLERAFTLSSCEQKPNNQTLEFLGDAILEFIVSERLYKQNGNKSEGELTELRKALVSDAALAPVSKELGLDQCFNKGKNDTNNKKAIPSVYEALVAAIYLDGGLAKAKKFVKSTLNFKDIPKAENYKGQLQEHLQGSGKSVPEYRTVEEGTAQKPHFVVEVQVDGVTFKGEADTKKHAEQNAAKAALEHLKQGEI